HPYLHPFPTRRSSDLHVLHVHPGHRRRHRPAHLHPHDPPDRRIGRHVQLRIHRRRGHRIPPPPKRSSALPGGSGHKSRRRIGDQIGKHTSELQSRENL